MLRSPVIALGALAWVLGSHPGRVAAQSAYEVVPIYQGGQSRFMGRIVRETVRDSARWVAIWDSSGGTYAAGLPLPQVDFRRHALFVAAGPRATPGDSLTLSVLQRNPGYLRVAATRYLSCIPISMISWPIAVLRIPRDITTLSVQERTVRSEAC
jgi:hypothetical protein